MTYASANIETQIRDRIKKESDRSGVPMYQLIENAWKEYEKILEHRIQHEKEEETKWMNLTKR